MPLVSCMGFSFPYLVKWSQGDLNFIKHALEAENLSCLLAQFFNISGELRDQPCLSHDQR